MTQPAGDMVGNGAHTNEYALVKLDGRGAMKGWAFQYHDQRRTLGEGPGSFFVDRLAFYAQYVSGRIAGDRISLTAGIRYDRQSSSPIRATSRTRSRSRRIS